MILARGPPRPIPPPPPPDPTRPPPGPRGWLFSLTSAFLAACSSSLATQSNARTSSQEISWTEYASMDRILSTRRQLPLPHSRVPYSPYSLNANKKPSRYRLPSNIQDDTNVPVRHDTERKSSTHPPLSDVQDGSWLPTCSTMSKRPSTNPPPSGTQGGPSLPVNHGLELSGYYRNVFAGLHRGASSIDTLPVTLCGAIPSPYTSSIFSQNPVQMIAFGVVTQIFSATAAAFTRTI